MTELPIHGLDFAKTPLPTLCYELLLFRMRFRAKFELVDWSMIAMLCYLAFLVHRNAHRAAIVFLSIYLLFLGSLHIFKYLFIYWDLNADSLRERRFLNTKDVAWQEVNYIGPSDPRYPSTSNLVIDYARPAPMSDRGRIYACPRDREKFLISLRQFAPHAEFDL